MSAKNNIAIALFLAVMLLGGGAYVVLAQNQPVRGHMTWKTSNFYPANFTGRALPSPGSSVSVAVEATRNGTLLDLAQSEISWEMDGKFIGGGKGMKRASFTATKGVGDSHFVRVSISTGSELIETSLRIPTSVPMVAIDAPYPNAEGSGNAITLRALPFFFNASSLSDLSFLWFVDGERADTGSDHELTISGNAELAARQFLVSLETQNRRNLQEIGRAKDQFSIFP